METPTPPTGFHKGLTSYGDAGFSYFLRTAFIKGGGFSNDALARPVIGLINTGSGYNPGHGNAPARLAAPAPTPPSARRGAPREAGAL